MSRPAPTILTIAGTDPSGGAGIQVDLQVMRDFGFHGASAVTAVVWQNTQGVGGFQAMGPGVVRDQIAAVFDDLELAAIKLGMLASAENIAVVSAMLTGFGGPVVCDPVLTSGDGKSALSRQGTAGAMAERLFDRVDVLTPNLPEAEVLLGRSIATMADAEQAAADLVRSGAAGQGPRAVLLKSGHFDLNAGGDEKGMRDLLATSDGVERLAPLERVPADVRGTGCQLASAIACLLAGGLGVAVAVDRARHYLNRLLHERRESIGKGRPIIVR